MLLRPMLWIATSLALCGCAVGSLGSTDIVSETFYIPAIDPGIQLHIRNKHLVGAVDFIRKRRGVARVDLLGWSWGTSLVAAYAAGRSLRLAARPGGVAMNVQ